MVLEACESEKVAEDSEKVVEAEVQVAEEVKVEPLLGPEALRRVSEEDCDEEPVEEELKIALPDLPN